uniref:Rhabdomeric opsin n=1 Tax=Chaetopleura apiculata TaxID=58794 RepID=A0A8H2S119_CHAAP|nr:Rhabdomeric opsin [Chaetopleura apiculata]
MATTMAVNTDVTGYFNSTPVTTTENPYGDIIIHPHWKQFPPVPDYWHYLAGAYMTFMGITGVVGNLIVIWIFSRTKSLRTPANMFVVNLAISDLTFSAVNGFPLYTISAFNKKWIFGKAACELYGLVGGIFGLMSINTMAMIALDRYLVIARPLSVMRHMSHKRAFFMLMLVWIWSILWAIPPIFGWGAYIPEGFQISCSFDYLTRTDYFRAYIFCMYICSFVVPVLIIFFCYVLIVKAVADHEKEMASMAKKLDAKDIRQGQDQRTELKTAKIAFYTITLFLLSWTPYAVIALIGEFGPAEYVTPYAASIPVIFAKTSAMYNPIVYALSHPKFREVLNKSAPWLLICCKPKTKPSTTASTKGGSQISRAGSTTSYVPGMSEAPSDVSNISEPAMEMTSPAEAKPAAPAAPAPTVNETKTAAQQGGGLSAAQLAALAANPNQLVDIMNVLAASQGGAQKDANVYAISGSSSSAEVKQPTGQENKSFEAEKV